MNYYLFSDASVHPQSKVGCGAYLLIENQPLLNSTLPRYTPSDSALSEKVVLKTFQDTSSTKAELQILLEALENIEKSFTTQQDSTMPSIYIFTDSQNTISLLKRREKFEKNDFITAKNKRIRGYKLYQTFYDYYDCLDLHFFKIKGHKKCQDRDIVDEYFSVVDTLSREQLRTIMKQ